MGSVPYCLHFWPSRVGNVSDRCPTIRVAWGRRAAVRGGVEAEVHDGWQVNLFLEDNPDPDSRSLADWLEAAPGALQQQKAWFQLLDRSTHTSVGSLVYARLEYTFTSRDALFREWYVIAKRGNGKKVFIFASTAVGRWEQDSWAPQLDGLAPPLDESGGTMRPTGCNAGSRGLSRGLRVRDGLLGI